MITVFKWRMVSHEHFYIANSVLRARYTSLVRPFVQNTSALNTALRTHGAVISGSIALQFFLSSDDWSPNDMDIYVAHSEFDEFTKTLEHNPALQFTPHPQSGTIALSATDSLEIAEVRRYTTLTGRMVDVIRSRRDSPVSPLVQFWTSLLVNFVYPDGCASAYPRMMFNGRGYVREYGMTATDHIAMCKYMSRQFREDEYLERSLFLGARLLL